MKSQNGKKKLKKRLKIWNKRIHIRFSAIWTIRSPGESIYTHEAKIVKAEKDQSNLLKYIAGFNKKSGPKTKEGKDKKRDTYESAYALYEGVELTLNPIVIQLFIKSRKLNICFVFVTQSYFSVPKTIRIN